ncbi:unnamed protein product, partial [Effrenium voratum]
SATTPEVSSLCCSRCWSSPPWHPGVTQLSAQVAAADTFAAIAEAREAAKRAADESEVEDDCAETPVLADSESHGLDKEARPLATFLAQAQEFKQAMEAAANELPMSERPFGAEA